MKTRREFLGSAATATLAGQLATAPAGVQARRPDTTRKRIAIITTVWNQLVSPAQLVDRFLIGYPRRGEWHVPDAEITAVYVDQRPADDLSRRRAREFKFAIRPTIAECLSGDGKQLDVDGVLLLVDDGDVARNPPGQTRPSHDAFFQTIIEMFHKCHRSVPVFSANRLAHSFDKAADMMDRARGASIPLLAGSYLPLTWRLPDLELPLGCAIDEALVVAGGQTPAMEYHALEALQSMVERRQGGESGVRSVQRLEGDAVWRAADSGAWSWKLLRSALSRSDLILGKTLVDARPQDLLADDELQRLVQRPLACIIRHNDGLKSCLLILNGAVGDFTFAAKLTGDPVIASTQFYLPSGPNAAYTACLVAKIEQMMTTGVAPYPAERTLLVGGILENWLNSGAQNQAPLTTPQLAVSYSAPRGSHFCRD